MADIKDYVYQPAIGFDTETHPFEMGKLIPPMVCVALAMRDDQEYCTGVFGVKDSDLDTYLDQIVAQDGVKKVGHNIAFDLAVVAVRRPDLMSRVFEGLVAGIYECTIIREKLLHLSTHGDLEFFNLPDGQCIKLEYSLAALTRRYLGKDRKGEKNETDSWRRNYNVLETLPVSQWPEDAVRYVSDDAEDTLRIREIQESERYKVWKEIGHDPFETQDFQVACDFALQLIHAWGFMVDKEAKAVIERELAEELKPEKMQKLIMAGILIPGKPSEPYKNGAKNFDGTPKMKAAVPERISRSTLIAYIEAWARENKIELKRTAATAAQQAKGETVGQISTAIEFFEENRAGNVIFEEYYHRAKLQKLVTTELPRMNIPGTNTTADIVHPCFDVLKKTGRTSSFASDLYPSFNCQNVHPKVRGCFIPRPGNIMVSIDYSGMELGTLAQKVYNLFGSSVHRDMINANIDNHTYLGSQLAYALDVSFRAACDGSGVTSPQEIYAAFAKCNDKTQTEPVRKFFAHYRKFAKPTGLGYPGGLGPKTFIQYAKGTYGIEVDLAMATQLRDIWHSTYPEMKAYFRWVTDCCVDPFNEDKYAYTTPMGMYRAGADFCSCANGAALQAFSAEGAKLAVFSVVRACYDPALCSILYGKMKPLAFIHDELLFEAPLEEAHELSMAASEIMVDAFKVVTPDVAVKAQPVLMERWNKLAEPVFGADGRLKPWKPAKK